MPVLLALLALLLICAPAQAHHNPDHSEKHPEIGWSKKKAHGYEVTTPDGFTGIVHGPDPEHHCKGTHSKKCQLPPPPPPPPPPPSGACATDYYQHFLYAYPAGGSQQYRSHVENNLDSWVATMNSKLNESSLASGGPTAAYKVLCDTDGTVRLDVFAAQGSTFYDIVASARDAGFTSDRALYSILYDGAESCGIGYVGGENYAPQYGVTWRGCWGWHTLMHENGHNQGVVRNDAPNASGGWHCTDERDIMCYSDYPNYPTMRYICDSPEKWDCNHDDYFDTAPEPGEWLTRDGVWNMGSTRNQFIRIAGTGPPSAPVADPSPHPDGLSFLVGLEHQHPDGLATDPDGDLERFDWSFNGDKSDPQVTGVFHNTSGYISGYRAVLPGPKMTALTTGKAVYTLMVRDRGGRATSVDHVECFWPC